VQRERERRREKEIRELREFSSKLPLKLQQKLSVSEPVPIGFRRGAPGAVPRGPDEWAAPDDPVEFPAPRQPGGRGQW